MAEFYVRGLAREFRERLWTVHHTEAALYPMVWEAQLRYQTFFSRHVGQSSYHRSGPVIELERRRFGAELIAAMRLLSPVALDERRRFFVDLVRHERAHQHVNELRLYQAMLGDTSAVGDLETAIGKILGKTYSRETHGLIDKIRLYGKLAPHLGTWRARQGSRNFTELVAECWVSHRAGESFPLSDAVGAHLTRYFAADSPGRVERQLELAVAARRTGDVLNPATVRGASPQQVANAAAAYPDPALRDRVDASLQSATRRAPAAPSALGYARPARHGQAGGDLQLATRGRRAGPVPRQASAPPRQAARSSSK